MATQTMTPSSTMSTTSMTAASTIANSVLPSKSDPPPQKAKMDEAIQKMQSNLIRYARAQDRRMVLRSLKDVKFLSTLDLDPIQPSEIDLSELENEVNQEKVILNGIPFKPVGRNAVGASRGSNCSVAMLKGVCSKLCERTEVKLDGDELYKELIVRMAGTTASADPYFRLNSLFGSSDLLVMPLTSENFQAEKSSAPRSLALQRSASKDTQPTQTPINLTVYEAHGSLHMKLSQTYKFGLFRKNDVKSGRAWIAIDAVVSERANMTTGKGARTLNVKLPDLY